MTIGRDESQNVIVTSTKGTILGDVNGSYLGDGDGHMIKLYALEKVNLVCKENCISINLTQKKDVLILVVC